MKAEQISDALQDLRPDLVEETAAVRAGKKKKTAHWKWAAAAACLCIVVGAVAVIGQRNADDGRITAEKITEYSGAQMLGSSTKSYLTHTAEKLEDLMHSPIRDDSTVAALPVYRPKDVGDLNAYADDRTEFFARALADVLGGSGEITTGKNTAVGKDFFRTDTILCTDLTAKVRVDNTSGAVQTQYILNVPEGAALLDTALPVGAGEEALRGAAEQVLEVFGGIFDRDYQFRSVSRRTDDLGDGSYAEWVYVRAWESDKDPAQQLYNMCFDYVYLTFTNSYGENPDVLQLVSAWTQIPELEPVSDTPLLSIDAAEEELEKGYIFLGHVCPVCLSTNTEVDFSDYDGVEIVYRSGMFYTYNIPYYAFYKQAGEEKFAVTYVPAVHVEGMEEYFEAQEAWHGWNN